MSPEKILSRFYPEGSFLYEVLIRHGRTVAAKSLEIAARVAHLEPDTGFIEKAAMLHDIGVYMTRSDTLGCTGEYPYVCHGYLGRQLLDEIGPGCGLDSRYGMVCERHTGAGITLENIIQNNLPLPRRDMVPQSLEEKIICVADKFHSKNPSKKDKIYTVDAVIRSLSKIDPGHGKRFTVWAQEFGLT
ncbi:MAG: HD domain-containing protein [Desulfobacteraceae bacterium]|nr:MAG: HD domain-containing protein [Desulfobacteraceae bacterium]